MKYRTLQNTLFFHSLSKVPLAINEGIYSIKFTLCNDLPVHIPTKEGQNSASESLRRGYIHVQVTLDANLVGQEGILPPCHSVEVQNIVEFAPCLYL